MADQTVTSGMRGPDGRVLVEKALDMGDGTFARLVGTPTSSLQTTADLTKVVIGPIVTAATTVIIPANTGQKGRVYRLRIDVAGANVLTFTDATGVERMNFTGAGFRIYDFSTRAWFVTGANTAFSVTTSTTAEVNIVCEYTRVA